MIDMMFPFCGLSVSRPEAPCVEQLVERGAFVGYRDRHHLPPSDGFLSGGRDVNPPKRAKSFCQFFGGRLLEWKHDDRARCLASADELVRGCSLPKRKVLTTLLATTPCATASNRDFAPASISLRFDT
jgi:hypothetical protein